MDRRIRANLLSQAPDWGGFRSKLGDSTIEELDDPRDSVSLATEVCDVLDAAVKNRAEARVLARVIERLRPNNVERPAGAPAERRSNLSMRSAILEIIKAEAAKSPIAFDRSVIADTLRSDAQKPRSITSSPRRPQFRLGVAAGAARAASDSPSSRSAPGHAQLETRPAPATSSALYLHLYLTKNGRIVAVKELHDHLPDQAIEIARKAFDEGDSSCDGVEVWSFTRKIFGLGRPARKPGAEAAALAESG